MFGAGFKSDIHKLHLHGPGRIVCPADKEVWNIISKEHSRQSQGIELIASENIVSKEVLSALGSCMTNKYSEGQPGNR